MNSYFHCIFYDILVSFEFMDVDKTTVCCIIEEDATINRKYLAQDRFLKLLYVTPDKNFKKLIFSNKSKMIPTGAIKELQNTSQLVFGDTKPMTELKDIAQLPPGRLVNNIKIFKTYLAKMFSIYFRLNVLRSKSFTLLPKEPMTIKSLLGVM